MHVGRFETTGGEQLWGVVDLTGGVVHPFDAPFADWAPKVSSGSDGLVRTVAPVEPGARIFGVGMNYLAHLERLGASRPESMVAYLKPESAVVDPHGEIRHPETDQLDYEVELVVLVAEPLTDGGAPMKCVLGYTVGNDVSPRDVLRQTGGVDLFSMKAQDRMAPIGPLVLSLDACGGAQQPALAMSLRVNGEVRQHDSTENMIWCVAEVLAYIDTRNRLRAGDLIFTGTTCGVGMEDGRFLQPGDVVEAEIEGIGVLSNTVGPKGVSANQNPRSN
jgi:2-keto-4-pentenoate hydratase/2-oxohepta-3-ene-1,7-dioic acid hydratase in catechol pathway